MCFPLPPTSLARTGSLSRPQCRLPLGKCRSGSRLPPKGEATSHTAPSRALADPGVPLAVRLEGYAIGPYFQRRRHAARVHGPRGGRGRAGAGRDREEGCALWCRVFCLAFFFFFPRKKFALATPQGGRLLLPPPPPLGAHLLVQIAKRLPLRELQIL